MAREPRSGPILAEAVDPVQPFVQGRHGADVSVRQSAPVDEVLLVSEEDPLDTELRRNGYDDKGLVFDLLTTNLDDHLQNPGFLHVERGLWRPAPAFGHERMEAAAALLKR